MSIRPLLLDEPELEFGEGGKHVDPRFGLCRYGPLQPMPGDQISIGIVGTAETVEGFERWMDHLESAIPGKSERQRNLFPIFPGLGNENPFRCRFEVSHTARRVLPVRDVEQVVALKRHSDAVRQSASLFSDQLSSMLETSDRPNVIVVALPFNLVTRVINDVVDISEDIHSESTNFPVDFRDLLKAQSLHLHSPTQIVLPTLWDDDARIPRKLRPTLRRVQDPATRAWNLLNALFYKAGRAPWRLPRPEDGWKTCFVGIGFYRDLTGQRLLTSTAQLFDERGKGLILRGGRARTDKNDRHPYLDRVDAYDLLRRALEAYFHHHSHYPARLVIFKTSRFDSAEAAGFQEASSEAKVRYNDLIWINERSQITMYREGDYPPLRGTMIGLDKEAVLFTRGSVPYYRTYPGLRVPKPLMLRPYVNDASLGEISHDVLALSKMNWNSTQFDGALPIPIRAARQVGKVLKHVPVGQREATDYAHYM